MDMTTADTAFAVIQWPVSNLERSLAWYQAALGLSLSFPYTPGDEAAWLDVDGIGLGLIETANPPKLKYADREGRLRPIIQLRVKEIDALYHSLQAQGAVACEMQFKPDSGRSFTVLDPDGLPLSIWGGWPSEGEGPV